MCKTSVLLPGVFITFYDNWSTDLVYRAAGKPNENNDNGTAR